MANNNSMMNGLSTVATQLGNLSSLAGLSANADSNKAEALAVLQSEALTDKYVIDYNLLPVLFARDWDSQSKHWKSNADGHVPTPWKANQLFIKKIRRMSTDAKTGLVRMSIIWTDPKQAAQWANDLVRLTNEYRRDNAIRESERNIAYLTSEVIKTDVVGVKQAIYSIMQSEISKVMLARGNEEYALKVIDPAVPPEKSASPMPALWATGAFFGSFGLCCMVAFLRLALTEKR